MKAILDYDTINPLFFRTLVVAMKSSLMPLEIWLAKSNAQCGNTVSFTTHTLAEFLRSKSMATAASMP